MGNQATESNLLSTENKVILKDGDILSFATHAFTDKTNFSSEHGLVLTPPESLTFENDGLLTSKEISNLKLANSLVILSACDTDTPIFETAEEFSSCQITWSRELNLYYSQNGILIQSLQKFL